MKKPTKTRTKTAPYEPGKVILMTVVVAVLTVVVIASIGLMASS